jgi:PmbA protein
MKDDNLKYIISKLEKYSLDAWELYYEHSQGVQIKYANQQLENLHHTTNRGIGIRVLKDFQMGFSYAEDLSEAAILKTIESAINIAKMTSKDEYCQLPKRNIMSNKIFNHLDHELESATLDEKIDLAKGIESCAKKYDTRINVIESCNYQDLHYTVKLINSLGVSLEERSNYCGLSTYLVATEAQEQQSGFAMNYTKRFIELNPHQVGTEAAQKAVRMLGAKSIGTNKMTVLLDPYVAANFLELFSYAVSAEMVQKNKSFLGNKKEQKVLSSLISIIDDGTKEDGLLSTSFDGDGLATQCNKVVDKGILRSYLYNFIRFNT